MPHATSTQPSRRFVWIDRDTTGRTLMCIHHQDGHRIYRTTDAGWMLLTHPITRADGYEPHDDWPDHALPTPERTTPEMCRWLTIELSAWLLTAQGWS